MFSTHDAAAAVFFQYHYTAAEVANATITKNKVDGDSIYRVASLTKLMTAYVGELNLDQEIGTVPLRISSLHSPSMRRKTLVKMTQ